MPVKLVDEATIALMRTAGCYSILIGVESGNNEILKQIRKNTTIEESLKACEIVKKCGRTETLAGLKQAINDVIEMTQDLSDREVHDLDRALTERGIITLSELRRRYWRKYKAILKRAEIRNETEYYLISGILCDVANDAIEEERAQLAQLLDEYESKRI